jgi:hypothetical protein
MKRFLLWFALFFVLVFILPLGLMAEDYLSKADCLYEQGGAENHKRSIDLYLKVMKENPNDYEANWKCARAYREYGEAIKRQAVEGWKKACAKYGKEGMKYAQKAIEKEPNKPDAGFGLLSPGLTKIGKRPLNFTGSTRQPGILMKKPKGRYTLLKCSWN